MICRNHVDVSEGIRRCTRCGGTYCGNCLVTIQDQMFCATCKTEQLMDMRSGVDRTRLRYGRFWPRFGAQLLDGLIIGIPSVLLGFAIIFGAAFAAQKNEAASLFILFGYIPIYVFPVLYEALMLSTRDGQTIGKRALQLRVVRPDGSPITPGQAWGRALVRLALGVVCAGIVDYIVFFFTDEKTTLHDLAAGTRVVEVY